MNFCVDCRYHEDKRIQHGPEHTCMNPRYVTDLVTGNLWEFIPCSQMRSDVDKCAPYGYGFNPKDANGKN